MRLNLWLRRVLFGGALALALLWFTIPALASEALVRGTPARFQGGMKIKAMNATALTNLGTPPAGFIYVYVKESDGLLYMKDSEGTETLLGADGADFGVSGTDIIPAGTDYDLLLDDGSTLQWGDANPGTADITISRVSDGVLKMSGAAVAAKLRLLEAVANGTAYVGLAAPADVTTSYTITAAAAAPSQTLPLLMDSTGQLSYGKPQWEVLAAHVTPSSVAGNAGATAFTFGGDGSATIAANKLSVGAVLHIVVDGTITTDGGESETCQLTLKIGSKTIYTSAANSYSTASTAVPWHFDVWLTELTAGASGTARATGVFSTDPGAAGSSVTETIGASLTSFDTTATELVAVTCTWANGDATPDVATMTSMVITYGNYD